MLASPGSLSAWLPDSFLIKDYQLPMPDDHSEPEIDTCQDFPQVSEHSVSRLGSAGTSCETSAASSECSVDDLYADGDEDDCLFRESSLGASIAEIQESTDFIDVLSLSLGWTGSDDLLPALSPPVETDLSLFPAQPTTQCSPSHTCPSVPETSRKTHSKQLLQHRKWSSLSPSERLSAVEELSSTISGELGLREQIEIIKVINPAACVTATDTEFAIDLDSLNDEKLKRIQELIQFHSKMSAESIEEDKNNHSPHKKHSKKTKNSEKSEKRTPQKLPRHRQRKEYRQLLKERRSGLFVREEILALSTSPAVEEEDIDILG